MIWCPVMRIFVDPSPVFFIREDSVTFNIWAASNSEIRVFFPSIYSSEGSDRINLQYRRKVCVGLLLSFWKKSCTVWWGTTISWSPWQLVVPKLYFPTQQQFLWTERVLSWPVTPEYLAQSRHTTGVKVLVQGSRLNMYSQEPQHS